ncbi:hypothetical protein [Joostella sp. CR20]|uniref:hypothetical protein n=1 Tax=Joostella sp. CR20 TaxID=2804312 RepID=UPI00313E9218
MKKLVLASVLTLGSLVSFATVPNTLETSTTEKVNILQDEYTPIDTSELPTAVTDALERDFPGIQVTKAFKNESNEYKIQVIVGEQTSNLYATAGGEWLQK